MAVLTAAGLTMGFGDRILFSDADFEIEEKESVGLIGANGVGKTTLFKLITGEYEDYSGNIIKSKNTVVGYMEQHACEGSQKTVFEEIMTVFSFLTETEEELENLSVEIERSRGSNRELIEKQLYLTEKYQSEGGLTYKSRAKAVLCGLGFSENDFSLPVLKLSGGQKSKLSLGKLLLSRADLLLLDEPTNHLDIESVEWLEDFLKSYKGSSLIISHDRYFLDKVTEKTIEIENGRIIVKKGNYSRFKELKKIEDESRRKNYENTMAEVHRIEGIIAQQKQWNRERNIRTAQSKQKMIDRLLENVEAPEEKEEKISFRFGEEAESGNDVLISEELTKSYGDKMLFKDVSLHITKGQRVFVLGPNGSGKTTLLKVLTGEETADHGVFRYGANVKIGYFDQTLRGLNTKEPLIDRIWNGHRDMTETQVRSALARFMFRGDEVYKKMSSLSGGERARAALLLLVLSKPNLLLLDEPTNHLDIKCREALEEALEEYDGTVLAVSHDRYFINRLATSLVRISEKGTEKFHGGYDDYYNRVHTEFQTEKTVKEKSRPNDYKLRKEKESEIRKIKTAVSRAEGKIEEKEKLISQIENELSNPEYSADYEKIGALSEELCREKESLEELVSLWEKLCEELIEKEAD